METSSKLLAKNGVKDFNIRDVAKQSEVAVGTVYNYFGNKVELVFAVLNYRWKEKEKEILLASSKVSSYGEVVSLVYEKAETFIKANEGLYQDCCHECHSNFFELDKARREFADRLATSLEKGIAASGGEMCHDPCYVLTLGMLESIKNGNVRKMPLMHLADGIMTMHQAQGK